MIRNFRFYFAASSLRRWSGFYAFSYRHFWGIFTPPAIIIGYATLGLNLIAVILLFVLVVSNRSKSDEMIIVANKSIQKTHSINEELTNIKTYLLRTYKEHAETIKELLETAASIKTINESIFSHSKEQHDQITNNQKVMTNTISSELNALSNNVAEMIESIKVSDESIFAKSKERHDQITNNQKVMTNTISSELSSLSKNLLSMAEEIKSTELKDIAGRISPIYQNQNKIIDLLEEVTRIDTLSDQA